MQPAQPQTGLWVLTLDKLHQICDVYRSRLLHSAAMTLTTMAHVQLRRKINGGR